MSENTQETNESTNTNQVAQGATAAGEAEWKARVQGLDQKVTSVVAKNRELEGLLATQMMKEKEFQLTLQDREGKLKDYETQVAKWQTDHSAVAAQAANLAKTVERQKLFMQPDFADLAAFEAKDLLRKDLEGEALTTYLNEYRTVLGTTKTSAITNSLQGATGGGASTQKESVANLDTLYAQFEEAFKGGDVKAQKAIELQIMEVESKTR